ncbi:histidine phosphatase superfamily [Xylariaceae sp. FL0255]|nr:histidine phosphatase superfamily [Xylariaceae sp. FL0255]
MGSKSRVLAALAVAFGRADAGVIGGNAAGSSTQDVYPPNVAVNTALFPAESIIGYEGPTPTGQQPFAAQTATAYLQNTGAVEEMLLAQQSPLFATEGEFDIFQHMGSLSPWRSLDPGSFGLPYASPLAPEGCEITQIFVYYTSGATYPQPGSAPEQFAAKINNNTAVYKFDAYDELEFLATWNYKLGENILTSYGRAQEFMLGAQYRQLYGNLLNNYTTNMSLPVFRTTSSDNTVKTAHNFAAGFFGAPDYLNSVNFEIQQEIPGVNNSFAPWETCELASNPAYGAMGTTAKTNFQNTAFNVTAARLNSKLTGLVLTPQDVVAMIELCAYETYALGYSSFCGLFTQEDYLNYDYSSNLESYYNWGPGSPISASMGKGMLHEFYSRLEGEVPPATSALNYTLDNSTTYFPPEQSFYADAVHHSAFLDALTAFNFTSTYTWGVPLNLLGEAGNNNYSIAKIGPLASHLTMQRLYCPAMNETDQLRYFLNDAAIDMTTSHQCPPNPDGLCPYTTYIPNQLHRIDSIDWAFDCNATSNYTPVLGHDYQGRAPGSPIYIGSGQPPPAGLFPITENGVDIIDVNGVDNFST